MNTYSISTFLQKKNPSFLVTTVVEHSKKLQEIFIILVYTKTRYVLVLFSIIQVCMLRSYRKCIILLHKIGVKYTVNIHTRTHQTRKLPAQIPNAVHLYNDRVVPSPILWLYIMHVLDMNEQINAASSECDIPFVLMFDIFSLQSNLLLL